MCRYCNLLGEDYVRLGPTVTLMSSIVYSLFKDLIVMQISDVRAMYITTSVFLTMEPIKDMCKTTELITNLTLFT